MTENLRSSLQQYVTLHWKLFNEVLSINELDVSKWLEDTYGTKNLRHMDLRGFDFSYANLDGVDFSGSDWDPVASLVFCGPSKANYTIINGKIVVSEGQLTSIPMEKLVHEHSKLSRDLINI